MLIGGKNVREINYETLLQNIAIVFQKTFLTRDSVFENIRMGSNASLDEVRAAAKEAQIDDFIMSLPDGYDTGSYEFFQGTPTKVLEDGENIELGGRNIQVLHTPGHAPGHMCFWESDRGYLFTGDLVYKDTLFAYYPSTDPDAYLASLEKISELPVKKVFPAHHSLDIQPEILIRMRNAFRQLREDGKLHHGSGTFDYGDWAVWL